MKIQNVTVIFELLPEDYLGAAEYEFPKDCSEYLLDHYGEDREDREDWPRIVEDTLGEDMGYVQSNDSDVFILFLNALLDAQDKEFTITVRYSHIIWLFHDLVHVYKDATSEDIYVDMYSEERAVKLSMELCKENGIPLPIHILRETQEAYSSRFDSELVLDIPPEELVTTNFTYNSIGAI